MKKTFEFEQDDNDRWYMIFSEWQGDRSDLEMVQGADTLLSHLDIDNKKYVVLDIFTEYPLDEYPYETEIKHLTFVGNAIDTYGEGAYYIYSLFDTPTTIWLGSVLEFVFGGFPEHLYLHKI